MKTTTASPVEISSKPMWHAFRTGPPGSRFRCLYERRKVQRGGFPAIERWVNLGGGTLLIVLGVILLPAPGPGMPVMICGLGLLSSESKPVAEFADRCEVTIRGQVQKWRTPRV